MPSPQIGVIVLAAEPPGPLAEAMLADRLEQAHALAGPHVVVASEASAATTYQRLDRPAVVLRADAVTLPTSVLGDAITHLVSHPDALVIGPADDGSLALLGLPRARMGLLGPGGLPDLATATAAAARAGLDFHLLPPWWRASGAAGRHRLDAALLSRRWPARTADVLRRERLEALDSPEPNPHADLRCGPWKRISSRSVYRTPWLSVREDLARMPDGRLTTYSVVDCGQCVGVLPFIDPDTVLLVRQYRYVAQRVTWEMPTGGVDGGEPLEAAAHRELAEEAQVSAGRLESLGSFHTSKSVMDETAFLFAAYDLRPTAATGDDTAFIAPEPVPLDEAVAMALDGRISDSMTIIALLRVAQRAS